MKDKNLDPYATRWTALLAEHSILHKEHVDLRSSFTPPFSVEQIVATGGQCCSVREPSAEDTTARRGLGHVLSIGRHPPFARFGQKKTLLGHLEEYADLRFLAPA